MKIIIQLYKDKKDQVKSMFAITIVQQKNKIVSNRKKYKRQKFTNRNIED
jgi:hypothetical protein